MVVFVCVRVGLRAMYASKYVSLCAPMRVSCVNDRVYVCLLVCVHFHSKCLIKNGIQTAMLCTSVRGCMYPPAYKHARVMHETKTVPQ